MKILIFIMPLFFLAIIQIILISCYITAKVDEIKETFHFPPENKNSCGKIIESDLKKPKEPKEEVIVEEENTDCIIEKKNNLNNIDQSNNKWLEIKNASFRCMDKVTGQFQQISLNVGEEKKFKKLRILLHFAAKSKKFSAIDTCVFVEIFEERKNGEWIRHFSGWMFASNSYISALTHPVYDVWPVDERLPY